MRFRTALAAFALTLAPLTAMAQEISWDAAGGLLPWDPAIPIAHRFDVSGSTAQASLVAGAMHVVDALDPDSMSITKSDMDPLLLEGDWAVEAVVRMNSCDRQPGWIDFGTQVAVRAAGRFVSFGVDEEGVGFVDIPSSNWVAGQKHLVDLTDAFHTFRCVKSSGQVSLYLDGGPLPVISLPFTSFPATSATSLSLGGTSIIGTSDWDQTRYTFTPDPWTDLGNALAGAYGDPVLVGDGTLAPGSPMSLTLSNALENTTAFLVIGLSTASAPLLGGILVPSPDLVTLGLPTGALGSLTFSANWPALPSGTPVYFQYWILDPAGPQAVSASNGLSGTTP